MLSLLGARREAEECEERDAEEDSGNFKHAGW
jgi:hypothetical protein